MIQVILLGMLGFYAIEDIKKRSISLIYLMAAGVIGIGIHIYLKDITVAALGVGAGIGIGLMLLSILTRESIGMGDGILFVVTGIYLGGKSNMELLLISLMYAAIGSLGVLLWKKGRRKQEIPFIPFVFLGYVTMFLEVKL